MQPTTTKAQINPGLSLWLHEKWGSRHPDWLSTDGLTIQKGFFSKILEQVESLKESKPPWGGQSRDRALSVPRPSGFGSYPRTFVCHFHEWLTLRKYRYLIGHASIEEADYRARPQRQLDPPRYVKGFWPMSGVWERLVDGALNLPGLNPMGPRASNRRYN